MCVVLHRVCTFFLSCDNPRDRSNLYLFFYIQSQYIDWFENNKILLSICENFTWTKLKQRWAYYWVWAYWWMIVTLLLTFLPLYCLIVILLFHWLLWPCLTLIGCCMFLYVIVACLFIIINNFYPPACDYCLHF